MQMNLIRPRYTEMAAANLPEMMKPATRREATSASTCRAVRGDWGERAPKDQPRDLGGPTRRTLRKECPTFWGNP
jgi:hypothetical protein